jgi:hypothetical protein
MFDEHPQGFENFPCEVHGNSVTHQTAFNQIKPKIAELVAPHLQSWAVD